MATSSSKTAVNDLQGKRILLGLNQLMASALSRVALPTFAGLRDDEERLRGAFLNAVSFTTAITAPMFLSLIAVSDLVVRVALGAKWMEAAPIISIIAGTAYSGFTCLESFFYC